MKIVIPDDLGLHQKHFRALRAFGNVRIYNDLPTEKTFISRIRSAEIITTGGTRVTSKIIDGAKNLKSIVVEASGYQQWVDTEYATKKGIKVLNCPTFSAYSVA